MENARYAQGGAAEVFHNKELTLQIKARNITQNLLPSIMCSTCCRKLVQYLLSTNFHAHPANAQHCAALVKGMFQQLKEASLPVCLARHFAVEKVHVLLQLLPVHAEIHFKLCSTLAKVFAVVQEDFQQ